MTELHCSGIEDMRQLEELVLGVYQRKPEANIDIWIRELTLDNPGLESMALADQMESYFDLDIAIQVCTMYRIKTDLTSSSLFCFPQILLLCCLDAICES